MANPHELLTSAQNGLAKAHHFVERLERTLSGEGVQVLPEFTPAASTMWHAVAEARWHPDSIISYKKYDDPTIYTDIVVLPLVDLTSQDPEVIVGDMEKLQSQLCNSLQNNPNVQAHMPDITTSLLPFPPMLTSSRRIKRYHSGTITLGLHPLQGKFQQIRVIIPATPAHAQELMNAMTQVRGLSANRGAFRRYRHVVESTILPHTPLR